ncbi:hypothetical protein VNO77_06715 [Canavalia gladiata]|uniref:Uncharacterized protein n=1 Tax=Canavalia gladiata TaxID=3824 RepID=A0AAN9QT20_CANGL
MPPCSMQSHVKDCASPSLLVGQSVICGLAWQGCICIGVGCHVCLGLCLCQWCVDQGRGNETLVFSLLLSTTPHRKGITELQKRKELLKIKIPKFIYAMVCKVTSFSLLILLKNMPCLLFSPFFFLLGGRDTSHLLCPSSLLTVLITEIDPIYQNGSVFSLHLTTIYSSVCADIPPLKLPFFIPSLFYSISFAMVFDIRDAKQTGKLGFFLGGHCPCLCRGAQFNYLQWGSYGNLWFLCISP